MQEHPLTKGFEGNMTIQSLHEALQGLPHDQRGPSVVQVKKLAKLIDSELPLQSFLEQLLPLLCDLFAAQAAVAWLRAQGAPGAVFGVRYKMDGLISSTAEQKKHERLVQLAWQQKQPMLAEPSGGKRGGVESNASKSPTGHQLLFGPVLHLNEPIALLELVLNESPVSLNPSHRKLYLRGIQLVADRVYGGLRNRMTMPAATIEQATQQLDQIAVETDTLQQQIRLNIESRLQKFHGWSFSSLDENQRFAKLVHQILDSYGLRVQCPECGHPAILRCLGAGNAKHGVFLFDHYLESGRTFHGGPTTVPLIRVVAKPARRPSLSNTA
jgi:hypothetical protein